MSKIIVALKLDRITGRIYDLENLMTFLDENNTYLDCVNYKLNTTSANGKMILRLVMIVSQNEIERASERTKIDMVGANKEQKFMKNILILVYDCDILFM